MCAKAARFFVSPRALMTLPSANRPLFMKIDSAQTTVNQQALLLILLLLLLHLFSGLFSRATWVSQYQKGKTRLDQNEARDDGVLGYSSISWTICIQSAPHSRQITTPAAHHSIFTGQMLFLTPNQQCQSIERQALLYTQQALLYTQNKTTGMTRYTP